jgi:DNA-binding transcriptional LysR family regulator
VDEDGLRSFVAVCETGSITRAAAALFRSQPAVSRRIAQLESEVGAPLFDRVPGGVRLSAAGEALKPFAEAAVAAIADARQAVRAIDGSDEGPVGVALVGTLAGAWLTAALRDFARSHPGVDVRLRTANSNEVIELVRRGDATFGVGYGRARDPRLRSTVLFAERLAIVCAADHPRAGSAVRSLRQLRDERWLAFGDRWPRTETNARYVQGLLAAAGVPPGQIQIVDSLTAQKRLVEAGFGIALMPDSGVAEERTAGTIATIDTTQSGLSADVILTTRAHGYVSHAARSLADLLERAGT